MTKLGERKMSGGIPAAALGQAAPAAAAAAPTKMAAVRGQVARGELVTFPGLGQAYVQLLSRTQATAIEVAVFDAMAKQGLPAIQLHAFTYDQERYARTLALAARDPDDHSKPFGTVEEWQAEDDDIIFAASLVYKDVRSRLDPIGIDSLDDDTESKLVAAFKKKDWSLLRSYGVATLVTWLATGALQLASSPTPASNTGPPSTE